MYIKSIILIILIIFSTGCEDAEQEARLLLNKAIKNWNSDNIKMAEKKFERIEAEYMHTMTATLAIKERAILKKEYLTQFELEKEKQDNSGKFSKLVVLNVNRYFNKNSNYPDSLLKLEIYNKKEIKKPLSMCIYNKYLFGYGYLLDCTEAEIVFNNRRRYSTFSSERKNERKASLSNNRKNKNSLKINIKELGEFPLANKTWGKILNPLDDIPKSGYIAHYINTNYPNKVISKEFVSELSIQYNYNKFHNIKSEDFGAYWVGTLTLKRTEVRAITINQSRAKSRVMIDGHIVYEGGSKKTILLKLKRGKHKVEVELMNNWFTTNFSVSLSKPVEALTFNNIKNRLLDNVLGDYEINYVGMYESSSRDSTVIVNIEQNSKKVVLILSSYAAIKWYISNPYQVNISAIIYASYDPGSNITGDISKNSLLLKSASRIGSYKSRSDNKCSCRSGYFKCEKSGILLTKKALKKISDYEMTGFTGVYSDKSIRVPQTKVNLKFISELESINSNIDRQRKACLSKETATFENLIDDNK
ncbi:MAG: hypothetical protein COA86_06930 [Kangiella sp.]|nr:MAG: hypothetical protein COA86_06930 [Kangiella sp.]